MDNVHCAVPASRFDYDQLADIYNRAREDYIVPMPMNARRMQEYVSAYDVDLGASIVAEDTEDREVNGICMLGVRENRTWITRLGVIPVRRRRKSGLFLMEAEIERSRELGKTLMQLEVIKGNAPAHRLFTKLGFEETRELHVIRRPPGAIDPDLVPEMHVETVPDEHVFDVLETRESGAAWTEETYSLQNIGNMNALIVRLPDGEEGWVAYQRSPFQLAHFVVSPDASDTMRQALIAAVHQANPLQDTKIENIADQDPAWPIFRKMGYVIAFSRIEMFLDL